MASPASITFDVHIHHHPGQPMPTAADIDRTALLDIMRAEQSRADRLSLVLLRTLEAHRTIRPTTAPDVAAGLADVADVRRALTADIVEFEEMRKALDDADYAPTLAGLREALSEAERAVRVWKEQDEALRADRDALRAEVAALTRERNSLAGDLSILTAECARIGRAIAPLWVGNQGDSIGKRVEDVAKAAHVRAETIDSLYAKIAQRDAQVAALTPGPWLDPAVDPPPIGEPILTLGKAGTMAVGPLSTFDGLRHWLYRWRRIPSALLMPPEGTP